MRMFHKEGGAVPEEGVKVALEARDVSDSESEGGLGAAEGGRARGGGSPVARRCLGGGLGCSTVGQALSKMPVRRAN